MHTYLSSDDLEVALGDLLDEYAPRHGGSFGLLAISRSMAYSRWPRVEVTIHLDGRFTGDHITALTGSDGRTFHVLTVRGHDLCEALRLAHAALIASAPATTAEEA